MRVRVTTEKLASLQIEVVEAGRGEWKVQKHLDGWQSGHYHVVVVRTSCDDRTKIAEDLVKSDLLDDTLNRLIIATGLDADD
jgi:hypothetical protein